MFRVPPRKEVFPLRNGINLVLVGPIQLCFDLIPEMIVGIKQPRSGWGDLSSSVFLSVRRTVFVRVVLENHGIAPQIRQRRALITSVVLVVANRHVVEDYLERSPAVVSLYPEHPLVRVFEFVAWVLPRQKFP